MSRRPAAIAAGLVLSAMVGAALAQSGSATFNLPRQSIDGGAQRGSSASFVVDGTVGQSVAGPAMSSATFAVRGGFHVVATSAPQPDSIFSNGFEP